MEPALGVHHLSGALRILIVAQHHIAAPHTQLAVVQLDLAVAVVLADGADVLGILRKVDEAAAGGLGAAVELGDHHAVVVEVHQGLGVKHRRHTVQSPQIPSLSCLPVIRSWWMDCTSTGTAAMAWLGIRFRSL